MPFSVQGGGWQGGQGPWGRGPGGPQPPDLEELLRKGQDRVKQMLPSGFGGAWALAFIVGAVLALWLATGLYRVQPDEQGVELVFGKWVSTTQPGLNYNWPSPIGQIYTPKVTRVNRIEVGFRSAVDTGRVTGRGATQRQVLDESLMLTGDENIVDINFVVFWVIKDAGEYLFNIRGQEQTVKAVAESVVREVIGKTDISRAMAEGRQEVEVQTIELMQSVLDEYGSGIQITQVQLQKVDPPGAVIESFRDVQAAEADRERTINEAEAYANSILPRARGEAAQIEREAEGYKQEVVARAEGDAERFLSVYDSYKVAKDITVQRIYLETMQDILKGMNKIVIDSGDGGSQGVLPYLPLPELRKRGASQ